MKTYIVIGPESSGTRLVTKILMAGGCVGQSDHRQRFDLGKFGGRSPIVWRRSVPHNGVLPSIGGMIKRVPNCDPTVVVCVRDITPMSKSQLRLRTSYDATIAEIADSVSAAYEFIYKQIDRLGCDHIHSVYESLVLHPAEAQRGLLRRLGLNHKAETVGIRDENRKHWSVV